jgi:hypothetical protein
MAISLENQQILVPLNTALTVKSGARLRAVSRSCRDYIQVKEYSFYKIFKQLDFSFDTVLRMWFNTDRLYLQEDEYEPYYFPIEMHTHGTYIKKRVLESYYFWCLAEFAEELIAYNDNQEHEDPLDILQLACDHCSNYTEYKPLVGLLIQLCNEQKL